MWRGEGRGREWERCRKEEEKWYCEKKNRIRRFCGEGRGEGRIKEEEKERDIWKEQEGLK